MLGDIRTGILEFNSDLSEDLVDKLLCYKELSVDVLTFKHLLEEWKNLCRLL